ncbi:ISAs1 family transposase [Streptomyces sp. NPDC046866]|uniref:ISAs1 family transposase n=1 Tax=Streptomyces sp. NPDC046866 TaxID=3154921 RepID=UPI003451BDF2
MWPPDQNHVPGNRTGSVKSTWSDCQWAKFPRWAAGARAEQAGVDAACLSTLVQSGVPCRRRRTYTAIGAWLADRARCAERGQAEAAAPALAVDGKTVRGAWRADGSQVHLLAAMSGRGLVLVQREVDAKTNEITVFRPLLQPLDMAGWVVTFDALHSQVEHARFLVEDKQAHYIAMIKGNQPTLHRMLKNLPWRDMPLLDKTRATGHGRDEIRRMKTATMAKIPFPYAVQVLQIVRRRRIVTTGKVSLERVYAVTSLPDTKPPRPSSPAASGSTGASRTRSTTSGTSPTQRMPRRCGPAPHPGPWPPCGTSPSGHSGSPTAPTSPLVFAITPATPPAPSPPWVSRDRAARACPWRASVLLAGYGPVESPRPRT